jgi:outer membrane protein
MTKLRSMVVKNPITGQLGRSRTLLCRSPFLAAACAVMATVAAYAQPPATPPAATPPAGTPAVAPGPVKIGIINGEAALAKTKEGTAAIAEIDKKMGPKAQQIQKDQADLNDLQKKLDAGGNTMSAASKQELQNTIQVKTRSVQREIQDYQDEGQAEETQFMANLSDKLRVVLSQFATANGYTIIFNVSQDNTPVLWAADYTDITQAIIDAYDKAAPAKPAAIAPARPPAAPSTSAPKPQAPAPSATKPPAGATPQPH